MPALISRFQNLPALGQFHPRRELGPVFSPS